MNSRERFLASINHVEPDRVAMDLGSTTVTTISLVACQKLVDRLGLADSTGLMQPRSVLWQLADVPEKLLDVLGIDTRGVWGGGLTTGPVDAAKHTITDELGVTRYKAPASYWYDAIAFPLANASAAEVAQFKYPDPHLPSRYIGLEETARRIHATGSYGIVLNAGDVSVFESAWFLQGPERFFMDLVLEPQVAEGIMDGFLKFSIGTVEEMLERVGKYVDVIKMTDDLGTQQSLLISPDIYRRMIKPRQAELIRTIKRIAPSIKVMLHTCGAVYPLIPDFIEIGIDILNPAPVQAWVKGMDAKRLKKEFGDDLCFWGGIDAQQLLHHGSVAEITDGVKRMIDDLAPGGGYVLSPTHNIQAEVAPEKVVAMYAAAVQSASGAGNS